MSWQGSVRHPVVLAFVAVLMMTTTCIAAAPQFEIVIRDHLFSPDQLTVPANQRVKLVVHNEDATPEEFESYALNREKVIVGNGSGTIFIGPLKPGEYEFFGEFNNATARGVIRAE
ncbi:MAG: cupredoxin domain-containing protein [Gammaproteobacteria bacterium]|nr:cupredoxin domain-containing protein [Gammaproteobacteria bacterium]